MEAHEVDYIDRYFLHQMDFLGNLADENQFSMIFDLIAEVRKHLPKGKKEDPGISFTCKKCGEVQTVKPRPIRKVELCMFCELGNEL